MKRTNDVQSNNGLLSGWKSAGALAVVAILILMIILNAQKSSAAFESPMLLALLNTLFLCVIPLIIAYEAAKSHHATGVFAFLMVGCGLVFFGVSSFYAGWVMPLAGGSNPTVTLHNIGSLLAGMCQLVGAHFFLLELAGGSEIKLRAKRHGILYAGIFVLVSATAVLAFQGNLPVFFDPLNGPSPLRQLVLGGAVCLFAVAGFTFMEIYATTKTEFAFWYGLALWLIAIGLTCVLLQPSVGSALGWTGRGAQYIGCVYFIFAFLQGRRELAAAGSSSTTQADWTLWPYLEQRVSEQTGTLVQINAALQKEIAERKQAEEALRYSQVFLNNIIEHSPTSLWISDEHGTLTRMNQACRNILHLRDEEVVGKYNIFNDNLLQGQGFMPLVRGVFEKGVTARFIIAHDTAAVQGLELWQTTRVDLDVNISPIFDPQGKVINAIIQHIDITERKQAEEALKTSEDFLNDAQKIANMGSWELNLANQKVYWTDNCYALYGFQLNEIEPSFEYFMSAVHPDDLGIVGNTYEKAVKNREPSSSELRIVLPGGTIKWLHNNVLPVVENDTVVKLKGIQIDITERKRVEEALRESEAQLIMAQQIGHAGSWSYNLETGKIWGSAEGLRIYGMPPVAGDLPIEAIEACIPERARVHQALVDLIGEEREYDLEFAINPADGSASKIISSIARLEKNAKGKPIRIFGFLQDITARKQAEEELHRAKESLETANHELRRALDREQQLARTDPLTGIGNRLHFFELAEHEFQVATRYQHPFTIIMLDVDHFKDINDTFGHSIGDRALMLIAHVMRDQLRAPDVLARYGGEEFIALLPATDATKAAILAERIRERIAALTIQADARDARMTASIGVAAIASADTSIDRVIQHADQALYRAKEAGRNRVAVWDASS